jgi:hypothetical protein
MVKDVSCPMGVCPPSPHPPMVMVPPSIQTINTNGPVNATYTSVSNGDFYKPFLKHAPLVLISFKPFKSDLIC